MRVLLLSAYDAHSHRYWQHGLQHIFSDWQWQVLSLPPRHFSWRVRGNPLYWALQEREVLERDYDVLLATSMVDLATLRGLVPSLGAIPSALYFHENQFAYPSDGQPHGLLEAQMVSLYSALAADRILFNSDYNRQSFLAGCASLLARLPDRVPPGIGELLDSKTSVIPVPVDLPPPQENAAAWPGRRGRFGQRPLRLVWVGRFEHDKGGDRLLNLLCQLETDGLDYELALVGQQFRNSPPAFASIEKQFGHRLVQFGYVEATRDYHALLREADLVVATGVHEFQGIAVLEAVASGCLPVVPDRLAYRELYDSHYRYESHLDQPELEAGAAARRVASLAGDLSAGIGRAPDVSAFSRRHLGPSYRALLLDLARGTG